MQLDQHTSSQSLIMLHSRVSPRIYGSGPPKKRHTDDPCTESNQDSRDLNSGGWCLNNEDVSLSHLGSGHESVMGAFSHLCNGQARTRSPGASKVDFDLGRGLVDETPLAKNEYVVFE